MGNRIMPHHRPLPPPKQPKREETTVVTPELASDTKARKHDKLWECVKSGDEEGAMVYLDEHPDADLDQPMGLRTKPQVTGSLRLMLKSLEPSPVQYAAVRGNYPMIRFLLSRGASATYVSKSNRGCVAYARWCPVRCALYAVARADAEHDANGIEQGRRTLACLLQHGANLADPFAKVVYLCQRMNADVDSFADPKNRIPPKQYKVDDMHVLHYCAFCLASPVALRTAAQFGAYRGGAKAIRAIQAIEYDGRNVSRRMSKCLQWLWRTEWKLPGANRGANWSPKYWFAMSMEFRAPVFTFLCLNHRLTQQGHPSALVKPVMDTILTNLFHSYMVENGVKGPMKRQALPM